LKFARSGFCGIVRLAQTTSSPGHLITWPPDKRAYGNHPERPCHRNSEFDQLLNDRIHTAQSHTLEWIIIILILVEVVMALVRH